MLMMKMNVVCRVSTEAELWIGWLTGWLPAYVGFFVWLNVYSCKAVTVSGT